MRPLRGKEWEKQPGQALSPFRMMTSNREA